MSETPKSKMNTRIESSDEIDFRKIIYLALENWYLYIISFLLCVVISYVYVWYTQPVYQMSATVQVAESSDIASDILDEVIGGKKANIENEIAILSSRSLMEKAISTLNLNVNYTVNLGLKVWCYIITRH